MFFKTKLQLGSNIDTMNICLRLAVFLTLGIGANCFIPFNEIARMIRNPEKPPKYFLTPNGYVKDYPGKLLHYDVSYDKYGRKYYDPLNNEHLYNHTRRLPIMGIPYVFPEKKLKKILKTLK